MTQQITIGLIQTYCGDDKTNNIERVGSLVKQAAEKGASIICLQELFNYSYFARVSGQDFSSVAESIPGPTIDSIAKIAIENNVNLIAGSIYEKGDDGKFYNTAVILNKDGQIVGKYRKMHIPYDPNYYEKDYFEPGNLGYVVVELDGVKVCPLICYDQWFPEAARIAVLKGAQLLVYPTAIGWFDEMKKYEPFSAQRWEDAMRSHASLNGIFVAGVNRVGQEENLTFWGGSFIADPFGQLVAKASSEREEVMVVEIDLEKIFESQDGWGFLRNRRTDSYEKLLEK